MATVQFLYHVISEASWNNNFITLKIKPFCTYNSSRQWKYALTSKRTTFLLSGQPILILLALELVNLYLSQSHHKIVASIQLRLVDVQIVTLLPVGDRIRLWLCLWCWVLWVGSKSVSARYISFPLLYSKLMSYFWSFRSILYKRFGAKWIGFLVIETRGLWSVSIWILWP